MYLIGPDHSKKTQYTDIWSHQADKSELDYLIKLKIPVCEGSSLIIQHTPLSSHSGSRNYQKKKKS